ncbi:MAG: AI-2E family transporter [Candidatus Limnocylindria bacterium]
MNGSDEQASRDRRERWWRSIFIIIATIYVALLLMGVLVQILGGFVQIGLVLFVAWLLAFVLSPVVAWLHGRLGVPRGVAIGAVYAGTLILSAFLLFYAASSIGASVEQMTEEYPATRTRIESTLRDWAAAVSFGRFDPDLPSLYEDVEATALRIAGSALGEVPGITVALLGSLVIVIILSLYMLADSSGILSKFNRVVPNRYADQVEILERTVSRAFGGFLRAQVILAGIQTLLTVAVVLVLGLPYGFLISAVSAIAMLIPFFGPPLALIPPIAVTAIFAPQWIIVVAPALLVVQTVLVNYLHPRLMRDALGMHPILVLVGLLVGSQVAGLWGALFGIPILAVLNVFFNYAVNLRTLEETPMATDEVLEEVRLEAPEATPEELVALAADRVMEEAEDAADAAEAAVADAGELATDDLRAAAGEQRRAADEIGETAADLHEAADETGEVRRTDL